MTLGKGAGAKGAENFFLPPEWVIFVFTLCVYTQNTKNYYFVQNSKMGRKHNTKI